MGTFVQLLLSFSNFKSLFSLQSFYCVLFRLFRFFSLRFVSLIFAKKTFSRNTKNFAKMLFIFAKLRNSFRFRFAKISRNEIPLKTLTVRSTGVQYSQFCLAFIFCTNVAYQTVYRFWQVQLRKFIQKNIKRSQKERQHFTFIDEYNCFFCQTAKVQHLDPDNWLDSTQSWGFGALFQKPIEISMINH